MTYPVLSCTAIDAREPRALADFYCALLGLHPRPGDEPPPPPAPDDTDWIVLLDADEQRVLAVQEKQELRPCTWTSECRIRWSSRSSASGPSSSVPAC